ncbi:MAG: hypothetical protein A4E63_03121 [Syntrophorhabdus sp. PtaU1.Bin050]|jgi:hypothetical protein|nr:MAG: hypothetical protein A4E63_03121 [Syntrophorhabdus sp. PtaU1.Bin050]
MKVYVNGQEIHIVTGMTVRHALIAAALLRDVEFGKKTYDEKGNEIGLGGALTEGSRIYVK